jgi:hypothetical protein
VRQLLIVSAGYGETEAFWRDFGVLVHRMTGDSAGRAWSRQKRDRILFVGHYTGGGAINSDSASFGARVVAYPGGEPTLAVDVATVYRFVDDLQAAMPWVRPLGATVLFAEGPDTRGAAANSSPPSFLGRDYGVAKVAAGGGPEFETYTFTHELAHASMNFVDEYVEPGLERVSLKSLEVLRPQVMLDGSWDGVSDWLRMSWDIRIAEILAGNGPVNVAPRPDVSTTRAIDSKPEFFEYEGGLFFGRGVYHDAGSNLMNSDLVRRGPGDGFSFDHSPSQQRFIDALFGDAPYRANDRLRTAGPVGGTVLVGPVAGLLLYDADKRNSLHPTTRYDVVVRWRDRRSQRWVESSHAVSPAARSVMLSMTGARREEELLLRVACTAGMTQMSSEFNGRDVCDSAHAFVPTMTFPTPYQEVNVPVDQPFTTYWWRFRTHNGVRTSGWTGWSSFYRSF